MFPLGVHDRLQPLVRLSVKIIAFHRWHTHTHRFYCLLSFESALFELKYDANAIMLRVWFYFYARLSSGCCGDPIRRMTCVCVGRL